MEWKAEIPAGFLEGRNAHAIVAAYFEFSHLKQLYRQGWLRRGIPKERCESVAEHTFGVAVLAVFLADNYFPELDTCQVARLALVHDFGEIYAGDIIPVDGISAQEKQRMEYEAVTQVFARFPKGDEYLELWEEYERGISPEARLVKQVDRLEMALQASVYEHQGAGNLQEFFESAAQAISDPELREIMAAIELVRIIR